MTPKIVDARDAMPLVFGVDRVEPAADLSHLKSGGTDVSSSTDACCEKNQRHREIQG
jgi:hypothetical protein